MKFSYLFFFMILATTVAFSHSGRGYKVIMDNHRHEKLAMASDAKLPVMMEISSSGSVRINNP